MNKKEKISRLIIYEELLKIHIEALEAKYMKNASFLEPYNKELEEVKAEISALRDLITEEFTNEEE